MRYFLFLTLPCALAVSAGAQNNAPIDGTIPARFPFVLPWDDATQNAVSVADLNPAPLEAKHRVVVQGGHFYDQNGRRVKFLGVNFAMNTNFPEKADAEKIAARLHKFGINCVRMHHMDTSKAPRGIFDKNFKDWQHLDADQLDLMDYLISQFKRQGIYVDLNLHVGRELGEADGFAPVPDEVRAFRYSKVLSYFEPRMIELQKNYARDLLTHKNPYTGTTYADEPTIALIEINNEDTLLGAGFSNTLLTMPEPYRGELLAQWNAWLHDKYGTTAKLMAAWNAGAQPLGENTLPNAEAPDVKDWALEHWPPALLKLAVEDVENAPEGMPRRALHITIPELENKDRPRQLHRLKLDWQDGKTYTLRFWAKADAPRALGVDSKIHQAPWTNTGLNQTVQLSTDWKLYAMRFTAQNTQPGVNRISFKPGYDAGEIWLAGVTLRPGSEIALPEGESLEKSNLGLPEMTSTPQGEDFAAFLMDVESRYAAGIRNYIHDDLKSPSLVTCSQASYGGLGGVWRESQMDWVDMHAYWQHPQFPGKPWDATNWRIPNISLTKAADGGTLTRLSAYRVAGKPFTVSEYNHPSPNEFAAEGLPMLAAFAAWQDWDGFFLYTYAHEAAAVKNDHITSYFDVSSNPPKMAFCPAAARIFLTGEAGPAPQLTLVVPQSKVAALVPGPGRTLNNLWASAGATNRDLAEKRVALRFGDGDLRVEKGGTAPQTAPLDWDTEKGLFRLSRPDCAALIGFASGQSLTAGTLTAHIEQPSFAVLTLTANDGKPLRASSSLLLTALSSAENSGMIWNEAHDSLGKNWGSGPVQMLGVSGETTLQTDTKNAMVYALDATGARQQTVPSKWENGHLTFRLDPQYKTVWYEISAP